MANNKIIIATIFVLRITVSCIIILYLLVSPTLLQSLSPTWQMEMNVSVPSVSALLPEASPDEPCLRADITNKRANIREMCRVGQNLEKREVRDMLTKIRENDPSTVIFKVKNHIKSDITSEVLNSLMETFRHNNVCEALYLQNLGQAMQDEQIVKLIELLQYCTVTTDRPAPSPTSTMASSQSSLSIVSDDNPSTTHTGSPSIDGVRARRRIVPFGGDQVICHRCNRQIDSAFPARFWNLSKNTCRCRPIWCINVGECDYISMPTWKWFCEQLEHTSVTHMYVSEHIISADLKCKMRDVIRRNRAKHRFHNDEHNLDVIQRCTNCWWNPINSIKHAETNRINMKLQAIEDRKRAVQEARDEARRLKERARLKKIEDRRLAKEAVKEAARRAARDISLLDESHVEYWYYKTHRPDLLQTKGEKGERKKRKQSDVALTEAEKQRAAGYWRFECSCGEVCTSYENFRYHPTGLMFECAEPECLHWAHAKCVYGPKCTQESLDSGEPLYCPKCLAHRRRKANILNRTAGPKANTVTATIEEPPETDLL